MASWPHPSMLRALTMRIITGASSYMQRINFDKTGKDNYPPPLAQFMAYDLLNAKAPVLKGRALRIVARLSETPIIRRLLLADMMRSVGIKKLRKSTPPDIEGELIVHWKPVVSKPWSEENTGINLNAKRELPLGQIATAYRSGLARPTEVIADALARLRADQETENGVQPMLFLFEERAMKEAIASEERLDAGNPISALDGVPVVIKDEMDTIGWPTCSGTSFIGEIQGPATSDGTTVKRWREAGAIILGKAKMQELGISVFGINPNHGIIRNPINPNHMSGGSSSGSAAAVGGGFVPLALGADGGGSIRIPSALCGVYGLKATHGRISEYGAAPLCPSVGHIGPIADNVADLISGYALMSGPDSADEYTSVQPKIDLTGWDNTDLSGLRIGIYREWFNDAESEIITACEIAISQMEGAGAEIIEIEIPSNDIIRLSHLTTITREMLNSQAKWFESKKRKYGGDTRIYLAMANSMTESDDEKAKLLRHQINLEMANLFCDIDLLVTPSTGCTAPIIPKGSAKAGLSNLGKISALMRFMHFPNLTGQPAISIPISNDSKGLPIGLQLIAKPWEETLLFRCAKFFEDNSQ